MPAFRVGKPRVKLQLDAPRTQSGGAYVEIPIAWDSARYEDPAVWSPGAPGDYVLNHTGLWLIDLHVFLTTPSEPLTAFVYVMADATPINVTNVPPVNGGTAVECVVQEQLPAGTVVQGWLVASCASEDITLQQLVTGLGISRIGPERWT